MIGRCNFGKPYNEISLFFLTIN